MSKIPHKIDEYRHWYHYLRLTEEPPDGPLYINIEPTNACNLNCTVCSTDSSRKRGFMDMSLYYHIIGEARKSGVREVALFLAGEPLLHKDLPLMIEYASSQGLKTRIRTNATLLNREKSEALIDSGLDYLGISFDGDNKEDYESIRVGGSYEEVLDNLITFLRIKQERGSEKPFVSLQMIKMADNPNQDIDPRFRSLFEGLPMDEMYIIEPHDWRGEVEIAGNKGKRGDRYFPCRFLWMAMSIAWDGRVFCCVDLNGKFELGDIKTQSLGEIWHGERMVYHRRMLREKRYAELPLCAECHSKWPEFNPHFYILSRLPPLDQVKSGIRGMRRLADRVASRRKAYDKPDVRKIR
jgi:MoaA/NifB/PqqE/SkfB family radical SAM enzyme